MNEEKKPKGIGGWLLLFVIVLIVQLIVGTGELMFESNEWVTWGGESYFSWGTILNLFHIVTIGIVTLMWVALILIFLHAKIARKLVISIFLAMVVLGILTLNIYSLGCLIHVAYWWKSKRVKNTFTKRFSDL